jgi:3-hydroxyisobutyrate dehydrogenase-like beta-hydroxyacid dehydrogenase
MIEKINMDLTFIGFGEAATAFAQGWQSGPAHPDKISAYDWKTERDATRAEQFGIYARYGVRGCASLAEATSQGRLLVSVVTADQALTVAMQAGHHLQPGALYLDFNSVAPETKRAASRAVEAAGAHYVDVAVMSPVLPARLDVPLLIAGQHAGAAQEALRSFGFTSRIVEGPVGTASSIKMIRSVMVKGLEALTAECLLSARAAGVEAEVLASLEASYPGFNWPSRADYNLDRMIVHGNRRAAEMLESARTVRSLGQLGLMAQATAQWQARVGAFGLSPHTDLDGKLNSVLTALSTTEHQDRGTEYDH